MRKLILVLSLALAITGCTDEQKRAAYENDARECAKNNGIIVKTISYNTTYLFNAIPIAKSFGVYCQVNPSVGTSE